MTRRVHPRHTKHEVSVFPWLPESWGGTWSEESKTVRAQVEYAQEVVTDATDGTRVVQLLTLRVNPREDRDLLELFEPKSMVEFAGKPSWVLAARPVFHRGRLAYFEVKTGEDRPGYGGWWVTLTVHRSPGHDRRGNPTPGEDVEGLRGVFIPGTSTEPVDRDQSPHTTARLRLDVATEVASTDAVTIAGPPAAAAGRWQVDGDPLPDGGALSVPLRRS